MDEVHSEPAGSLKLQRIREAIRSIPDFPEPGILFRDITPVLANAELFGEAVRSLAAPFDAMPPDVVVAIESRGFLFGAPLALRWGASLVPVRKPGKLPAQTQREEYSLEYGTSVLEIHLDALATGNRTVIVDDLLATGGTASAARRLVESLGGIVAGFSFLVELEALKGRTVLGPAAPVHSSIVF